MATVDIPSTRVRAHSLQQHSLIGRDGAGSELPTRRPFRPRQLLAIGDSVTAGAAVTTVWVPAFMPEEPTVAVALTVLAASWPLGLMCRTRPGEAILGSRRRYADVVEVLAVLVAVLAIAGSAFGWPVLGGPLVGVVAILLTGAVVLRFVAARRERDLCRRGLAGVRTLVIGRQAGVSEVIDRLARDDDHALLVVGACVEDDDGHVVETVAVGDWTAPRPDDERERTPVAAVIAAVLESGAQAVCVAPESSFTGQRLRELGWALSDVGSELIVELGLYDVTPHRLSAGRAGAGAVVHVRQARPAGAPLRVKSVADRLLAAVGLVLVSPLLAVIAVAVRMSSPGPVFYRQVRVGHDGLMFTMVKFRTMYVDADMRRAELLGGTDQDGPMFKMRLDPRVTPIGRVLRKYSLDELPQLLNVLRGEMSLVGPRPPLPEEVDQYGPTERRRLRAVPGMTGLWQVSGRSNLSWDETIRLDLSYVDNWTLGEDARLLARTVGAVWRGTGAY